MQRHNCLNILHTFTHFCSIIMKGSALTMRKKVLLIIALALVAVALFLLGAGRSDAPGTDPTGDGATQPTLTIEQQIAAQKRAVDASAAVTEMFRYEGWTGSAKPEYYGGMYIEDNKLHVLVVPKYAKEVEFFKGCLSGYRDVIIFEETQYSYTTRVLYANFLFDSLEGSGYRVTSCGQNSKNDEIHIEVLKEDLEAAIAKVERLQKQIWGDITPPRVRVDEGEYSRLE